MEFLFFMFTPLCRRYSLAQKSTNHVFNVSKYYMFYSLGQTQLDIGYMPCT
ncbi:hypothetical protein Hanom_Chr17g01532331 [Helianthus anomalus]